MIACPFFPFLLIPRENLLFFVLHSFDICDILPFYGDEQKNKIRPGDNRQAIETNPEKPRSHFERNG